MKRYTYKLDQSNVIDAAQVIIQSDHTITGPAIDQLSRCEDFLDLIRKEREAIVMEMDRLRDRNQTKSVRFRELFISKLVYANIDAQLTHFGLNDPQER